MRLRTKWIGCILRVLVILAIIAGWFLTPTARDVQAMAMGSDRLLLAADGRALQILRTDFQKRRLHWFRLNQFSTSLKDSVVETEDKRFFSHLGVDPVGTARAVWAILRHRPIQGASTITMQLSDLITKDVLIENHTIKKGSILHKLRQVINALYIESKWSKNEILEAYLNLIHLRGEFQGVPALSYAYLNKHPLALDRSETEVIAAMIASPNQSARALNEKACRLLRTQAPQDDCTSIHAVVDRFFGRAPSMPPGPNFAPHLARRLFNENPTIPIIQSTIDFDLQRNVQEILERNLYHLKASNVHDSAAIVIDNVTGKVLAYVGAVEGSESPHVDGVRAYRQAGSALKPFLYTKAMQEKLLTPASILLDDATAISWSGGVYRPSNYDKHFSGPVSVREALASSLNVPAVKTVTIVGLHESYEVLQSIGLTGLKEPDFYGVSLALGAVEVRLEDLANAYRILANKGTWTPLLYQNTESPKTSKPVFTPESTYLVSSILSDSSARAIGFGWDSPLETPFWSAVKTGTSKDYRDNWCMGFSERYTVGVWAGNFDAQAMEKVSGVSGAGPSWYDIMTHLHRQFPSRPPARPESLIVKSIRHQWDSQPRTEYFISGTEPAQELVEVSQDKQAQFVFPAEGSVLVKDPQMDQDHIALFVRFKGQVPEKSQLVWDDQVIGEAQSPFKLDQPTSGDHKLSIRAPDGKIVSAVHFTIKGL